MKVVVDLLADGGITVVTPRQEQAAPRCGPEAEFLLGDPGLNHFRFLPRYESTFRMYDHSLLLLFLRGACFGLECLVTSGGTLRTDMPIDAGGSMSSCQTCVLVRRSSVVARRIVLTSRRWRYAFACTHLQRGSTSQTPGKIRR